MITFHFVSVQWITITQKTVIACNRLRLTITFISCLTTCVENSVEVVVSSFAKIDDVDGGEIVGDT